MGSPFFPRQSQRPGMPVMPRPTGLELPSPPDDGLLPWIGIPTRSYSPKAVNQAGLPPGKDVPIEIQAPSQYAGPTQEASTVPLVTPREEHADEIPAERAMPSYRTPNETSLGDWAKEIQRRKGPTVTPTYTNKDLDEVVRENRGSVMRVHSSSTTDQDEFDLDRREAREDTEYRAGQGRLNSIINDPDGSKAREEDYNRRLEIARVGGQGRLRRDEADVEAVLIDRKVAAEVSRIDALVTAGKMSEPEKLSRMQALKLWAADEHYNIRSGAAQRRAQKHPEDVARILPDDPDLN